MARNVFYRDFTICKAVLLAGLIGLAALMGEVPQKSAAIDTPKAEAGILVPAMLTFGGEDCDPATKAGIAL